MDQSGGQEGSGNNGINGRPSPNQQLTPRNSDYQVWAEGGYIVPHNTPATPDNRRTVGFADSVGPSPSFVLRRMIKFQQQQQQFQQEGTLPEDRRSPYARSVAAPVDSRSSISTESGSSSQKVKKTPTKLCAGCPLDNSGSSSRKRGSSSKKANPCSVAAPVDSRSSISSGSRSSSREMKKTGISARKDSRSSSRERGSSKKQTQVLRPKSPKLSSSGGRRRSASRNNPVDLNQFVNCRRYRPNDPHRPAGLSDRQAKMVEMSNKKLYQLRDGLDGAPGEHALILQVSPKIFFAALAEAQAEEDRQKRAAEEQRLRAIGSPIPFNLDETFEVYQKPYVSSGAQTDLQKNRHRRVSWHKKEPKYSDGRISWQQQQQPEAPARESRLKSVPAKASYRAKHGRGESDKELISQFVQFQKDFPERFIREKKY